MNLRWENKYFTAYAGIKRVEMVDGYNSILPGGKHFLMWDFDDVPQADVLVALGIIQHKYKLPRVWVLNTGRSECWHANCFKSMPWEECRSIVAATSLVDNKFVAIGILRGFFTLRYSPVEGREFKPAVVLPSKVPEDVDPFELKSFITYPKRRRS